MIRSLLNIIIFITVFHNIECLVPAKFQWRIIDFAWKQNSTRNQAIADRSYIPENNMPSGLARWRDKLFITVPRWKEGVPSSLNYVLLSGPQQQPLNPYPSWREAYIGAKGPHNLSNSTVVSTFRVVVDDQDKLWVLDNGVANMASVVKQIAEPAILVFDLKTDRLVHKYTFGNELRNTSVLTSIVLDDTCGCYNSTFAYVTDMGSSAIIVYDTVFNVAWRLESPQLRSDPAASVYRVGGVDFSWDDGVSSGAMSSHEKGNRPRDLYVQATSSTKTFKISNAVLMDKSAQENKTLDEVALSRNGVSCWNMDKPMNKENVPLIISDCSLLEFPSDIQVDSEGTLWILSNRQSRFLYNTMDFNQTNFRVLSLPVGAAVEGSACASRLSRATSIKNFFSRKKSPGGTPKPKDIRNKSK